MKVLTEDERKFSEKGKALMCGISHILSKQVIMRHNGYSNSKAYMYIFPFISSSADTELPYFSVKQSITS